MWLVALATTRTFRLLAGGEQKVWVWGVGKNRGMRALRTIRHPTRGGDVASRLWFALGYYTVTWGRGCCNRFRWVSIVQATVSFGFLFVQCPPPDNLWYPDTKGYLQFPVSGVWRRVWVPKGDSWVGGLTHQRRWFVCIWGCVASGFVPALPSWDWGVRAPSPGGSAVAITRWGPVCSGGRAACRTWVLLSGERCLVDLGGVVRG